MVTSAPPVPALERRLFTVDEYHAMTRAGILQEGDRVVLIDGVLFKMAAIGPRHLYAVNRLNQLFVERLQRRAMVSVQNPVRLNGRSEPEPDLALLRPNPDTSRPPGPEDVFLLVEVADSSLEVDRAVKVPLYARAGISEVWIVALREDQVEVYREPSNGRYKQTLLLEREDEVGIAALPEAGAFSVDELLG